MRRGLVTLLLLTVGLTGQSYAGAAAGPRDPSLSRSHFASPIGRARPVGLGVSASDIASVAVLAALLGGLGWGGWALLQDIQRVEFAPANEAPEVAFAAPGAGGLPGLAEASGDAPWIASGPEREAALNELYAPHDGAPPPQTEFGDGPIAAAVQALGGPRRAMTGLWRWGKPRRCPHGSTPPRDVFAPGGTFTSSRRRRDLPTFLQRSTTGWVRSN